MSWLFCAAWGLSEPVTSLNMWRRNGEVSLVGGTDLLCATFLGVPHLHLRSKRCPNSWASLQAWQPTKPVRASSAPSLSD
jgi:hypothetical protein